MTEPIHIRQCYREEFEQLGAFELQKRIESGLYDEEKRMHGWAWLDERARGEERAYRAQQLILQKRNDLRGNLSLAIAFLAVVISALALYRTWPPAVSHNTTTVQFRPFI
jgi:hypothetical protein